MIQLSVCNVGANSNPRSDGNFLITLTSPPFLTTRVLLLTEFLDVNLKLVVTSCLQLDLLCAVHLIER